MKKLICDGFSVREVEIPDPEPAKAAVESAAEDAVPEPEESVKPAKGRKKGRK